MTPRNEQNAPNAQPMKLADFLTGDEVMKTFNIDMSMLRRWHHRGLPVIRVGKGRWLVHEPSLCAWLKGRESSQPGEGEGEDA